MKKLFICGAITSGLLSIGAIPAQAQIDVKIGGHTKSYMGWMEQDDSTATGDVRNVDILKESEIHVNAEGVADNGLTYGFHVEIEADGGDDANTLEESYLYLSNAYGRVNLGSESGAPYLMQVSIPAAESNIDGSSQYINPVNYTAISNTAAFNTYLSGVGNSDGWDYDAGFTGKHEKITYISPNWNGFQFGLTYTPEVGDTNSASGLTGFASEGVDNDYDEAYEAAILYQGQYDAIGFSVGGGYTYGVVEEHTVPAVLDDYKEWNVALDLNIDAFGIGVVWNENNNGTQAGDEDRILVLGADYTTGPFVIGASYYDRDDEAGLAAGEYETRRYTGGVVYTAAPGLSFRGSLSYINHEAPSAISTQEVDATSAMAGIQLNF